MPVSVIGPTPRELPLQFIPPRIFIRERWQDNWQYRPDLEHIRHNYRVSDAGISEAQFLSHYGDVKLPEETAISFRAPLDIRDFWVRIDVVNPLDGATWETQFVGIVYNDVRDIRGTADKLMGKQPWVAYGPLKILANIEVSTSVWMDAGDEVNIGWLPSKNARDKRKTLVGNRSDERGRSGSGAYLFGGKNLWSNLEMLEYFVDRHVNQVNGPVWTIAGQTDILAGITDNVEFGAVENVAGVFRKLMKREFALDYKINYTNSGFEIYVFSQLDGANVFGDVTLPENPNIIRYEQGTEIDTIELTVVRTRAQMYDNVRIIGKRLVMCASLAGAYMAFFDELGGSGLVGGDLTPDWTAGLRAAYVAGMGAGDFDADEHDKARKRDVFKSVYSQFTAPSDWDHRGGSLSPMLDWDGSILSEPGDYQNSVRETLNWLPLKRDFDYSQDPPADNTVGDAEPEMQAPTAYIYNQDIEEEGGQGYIECHKHGMSVGVPHNELGVIVNATPNHLLALNHAFGEDSDESFTTDKEPLYDYDTLIATIAWETNQRLQLSFEVSDALKVGDGSFKVVELSDAEMWLLAANTVVGLNEAGEPLQSGNYLRVLRDDTPRLSLIAAGVVARYVDERVRSTLSKKCFWPYAYMLGKIFQVAETGTVEYVGAPVTEIEWVSAGARAGTMELRTGYAS